MRVARCFDNKQYKLLMLQVRLPRALFSASRQQSEAHVPSASTCQHSSDSPMPRLLAAHARQQKTLLVEICFTR